MRRPPLAALHGPCKMHVCAATADEARPSRVLYRQLSVCIGAGSDTSLRTRLLLALGSPRRLCLAGTPPDAACAAANPCMSPELGLAVAIDARKADHSGVQDLTLAPILADNATIGCVWLWLEYQDTSLAFAVGGDANNKDLPAVKEWAHKGNPSNMKLGPTADGKTVTLATGNGCAFTFTVGTRRGAAVAGASTGLALGTGHPWRGFAMGRHARRHLAQRQGAT